MSTVTVSVDYRDSFEERKRLIARLRAAGNESNVESFEKLPDGRQRLHLVRGVPTSRPSAKTLGVKDRTVKPGEFARNLREKSSLEMLDFDIDNLRAVAAAMPPFEAALRRDLARLLGC